MAQGLTSGLTSTIGTLGVTGKMYLQGTLTSSTGQTIAIAESPFYVIEGSTALSLSTDKKVYKPGETVTLSGTVSNLAAITASALTIQLAAGGEVLYTATADVPAGGSYPFTATTAAGGAGSHTITGLVTQNTSTLARVSDQYQVAMPVLTAAFSAPDMAGTAPFNATLTLTNTGSVDATVGIQITDDSGRLLHQAQAAAIPAGRTQVLQYPLQQTMTTTYTAAVNGDLNQTLTKTVAYDIAGESIGVTALIATDKISYDPNDQVALISTITNTSGNAVLNNVTARITVHAAGSPIYSETRTINAIMPGAASLHTSYWNAGTIAPGSYPATLQVWNEAGTVLATTTKDVVINAAIGAIASVKGQVLVDSQSLFSGVPVNVSYSMTNTGNTDLANLGITVSVVDVGTQILRASTTISTSLAMAATEQHTWQINTQGYTAKDYLVILRASLNGGPEETLAGSYFRVEGAPTVPALAAPAQGSDVLTLTPVLTVSNASDPNDDKLTYEFELYADSGLTTLIAAAGGIAQGTGATTFQIPVELSENSSYYWRSRAFDGKLYGEWMQPASFRVNVANDAPTAPVISSPADNTEVPVLTPMLVVNNASDPDSANLTYNFQVALDPAFNQITASVVGVFPGQGTTLWQVSPALSDNTWYWWKAQADDWLDTGPWSPSARFFVNTANDAPTIPVILSPANNAVVTGLNADIVLQNSTDPDSPVISYFFEVDSVPTFDSASVIRSGIIPAGPGTTTWQAIGLLDNTLYYVHARASDGSADSSWTPAVSLFINTANDAPTTPVVANPSIGAGVKVASPTLSVHNATDLDRDTLTYEFEVYSDAGLTNLVASAAGIAETPSVTSWTVPVELTENATYWWRARAYDGSLNSGWTPAAWFKVNTANDAPGAPALQAPADGSSIATLTPTLAVMNAVDPDSDTLAYDFEVYSGTTLAWSRTAVPQDPSGVTSVTVSAPLADNTVYQWRARAFDGDRYGPWMGTASFTVHIAATSVNATINFDPDTLNQKSGGQWVTVYIELPAGYAPANIDIASIRLEGSIPAETRPISLGDTDNDGIPDLMLKFKRTDVIAVLPAGDNVPVHVTGKVGTMPFEGVDIIRVIH